MPFTLKTINAELAKRDSKHRLLRVMDTSTSQVAKRLIGWTVPCLCGRCKA